MIKHTVCLECDEEKRNCVEIGGDENYVCLDCLAFVLDLNSASFKAREYDVKQNLEKIDPNNVPF